MHQHDHDFESIGSIDGVVVSHVMNAAAMSVQQESVFTADNIPGTGICFKNSVFFSIKRILNSVLSRLRPSL